MLNTKMYSDIVGRERGKSTNTTNITIKKIKKNDFPENLLLWRFPRMSSLGNSDIAEKKIIKDLTFILGCAKRMW
jgi:hypothetical protein